MIQSCVVQRAMIAFGLLTLLACATSPPPLLAQAPPASGPAAGSPSATAPQNSGQAGPLEKSLKNSTLTIPAQINLRVGGYFTWELLTSARGFELITGMTIDSADRSKSLEKIGDSLMGSFGEDKGRLIVTGMVGSRELRVVFEPDDNTGVIRKRFIVAQLGEGSVVQYWNQFLDIDPNDAAAEQKARDEMTKALTAFKTLAETKGVRPTHGNPGH